MEPPLLRVEQTNVPTKLNISSPFDLLTIIFDINPSELNYTATQSITSFNTDRMGNSLTVSLYPYNYIALAVQGGTYIGKLQLQPNKWSLIEIDITSKTIDLKVNHMKDIQVGYSSAIFKDFSDAESTFGGITLNEANSLFKGAIKNIRIGSKSFPADDAKPTPFSNCSYYTSHITSFASLYSYSSSYYYGAEIRYPILTRKARKDKRMVIACHDTDYEEKLIYGDYQHSYLYRFNKWANIDVFIYFNHNRIVIPPCQYIKIAHQNGVKMLGTIVCEAGQGETELRDLLNGTVSIGDKKVNFSIEQYAEKLATLAYDFGFDGYLINFEVNMKSDKGDLVANIITFLKFLRAKLKYYDSKNIVIWYDSITVKGDLQWQSALNNNNLDYFNVTDALFTDYHWYVDSLNSSEKCAGLRPLDVYFGNDIYGRGTYGGGQLNTAVAVKVQV